MKFDEQSIEDYLLGELTDSQLQAFEKQLKVDPALAEEVAQRKSVLGVVDAFGDISMMAHIKKINQEEIVRGQRRHQLRRRLLLAASIVLVLGIGTWLQWPSQSTTDLFAANYSAYDLSFTARSGEAASLDEINQLYQSQQYAKALPLLKKAYASDDTSSKLGLAIGICLIENEQYEQALQHFTSIKNKDFDLYQDHAQWYAALLLLRLDRKAEAKKELEGLLNKKQSYFYQQAKELNSNL